jgi:DNA-directed RNA polymerase subunit RPC12/RpoP
MIRCAECLKKMYAPVVDGKFLRCANCNVKIIVRGSVGYPAKQTLESKMTTNNGEFK